MTDEAAVTGSLTLNAVTSLTFAGEANSTKSITLNSGGDIEITGTLTSTDSINVLAGQDAAAIGSITTTGAALETTAAGSDISMEAGTNGGNILLTAIETGGSAYLTSITALDEVTLKALSGTVMAELYTQDEKTTEEALITADTLTVKATTAATLRTDVRHADIRLSSCGSINLTAENGTELTYVRVADGSINVTSYGNLTATDVAALGISDANDINLTTIDSDDTGPLIADLTLGTLLAGGRGDVVLDIQGAITHPSGSVTADVLDATLQSTLTITTQVDSLEIKTEGTGDVTITQLGTDALRITDADVMDGFFTLTHAGGPVILEDVQINSNHEDNDVHVTAGCDIHIGLLSAGVPLPR